ncbi:MAG: hypothetical protein ACRCXD_09405 [Luteolibacter sp.]
MSPALSAMNNPNEKPCLDIDPDRQALSGNLSALKQLRNAIDQILENGKQSEIIGNGETGIELVVLDESLEDQPLAHSWKDRLLIWLLAALVYSIPLAAIFGYYQFLKLLKHLL